MRLLRGIILAAVCGAIGYFIGNWGAGRGSTASFGGFSPQTSAIIIGAGVGFIIGILIPKRS